MSRRRKGIAAALAVVLVASTAVLVIRSRLSDNADGDVRSQVVAMIDCYQRGDMGQARTYTVLGLAPTSAAQLTQAPVLPDEDGGTNFFEPDGTVELIARNSTFSVVEVSVTGDRATVTVTARTPDMVEAFERLEGLPGLLGMTDDEIKAEVVHAIESAPVRERDFEVELVHVDGAWLVDPRPLAFRDGLTGGLFSAYQQQYTQALHDMREEIGAGS